MHFCVLISTIIHCVKTNHFFILITAITNYYKWHIDTFTLRHQSNEYLFTETFNTTNEHTKCSKTVDLTCRVCHLVIRYIKRIWRVFGKSIIQPWSKKKKQITNIDISKLLIQSIKHTHVRPTQLSIRNNDVLKFRYTLQDLSAYNSKQEISRDSQSFL